MNEKSNLDSDSDEYVDLSEQINDNTENIYQFALSENQLILKHIGKCNVVPDIIIMEKFGPDSNLNLYNCVYSKTELKLNMNEKIDLELESDTEAEASKNNLNLFFSQQAKS